METGLRELNRARTRAAIISAALTLVDERGFDRVTVDQIADTAGISPRTFSNYFAGKDEALFASEPEPAEVYAEAFAAQPAGLPLVAVLRNVLETVAGRIAARADELEMRLRVVKAEPRLIPAFRSRFLRVDALVADRIALHLGVDPETDLRPRLLAGVIGSVMHGSMEHWRSGDQLGGLPAIVTTSFDLLITTIQSFSAPEE